MKQKIKNSIEHLKYWELWPIHFGLFLIASSFCFHLQAHFKLTAVLSAAITGLIGSFIPGNRFIEKIHIESAIYSGAFVAMDSRLLHAGPYYVIIASFIGASLYFLMTPFFKGFGGKLGTIAFLSCTIAWFLGRFVP